VDTRDIVAACQHPRRITLIDAWVCTTCEAVGDLVPASDTELLDECPPRVTRRREVIEAFTSLVSDYVPAEVWLRPTPLADRVLLLRQAGCPEVLRYRFADCWRLREMPS